MEGGGQGLSEGWIGRMRGGREGTSEHGKNKKKRRRR